MTPEAKISEILKRYKSEYSYSMSQINNQIEKLPIIERSIAQKKICGLFKEARLNNKISQERLSEDFVLKSDNTLYFSQPKVSAMESRFIITAVEFLIYLRYFKLEFGDFVSLLYCDPGLSPKQQFNRTKIDNYINSGKMTAFDYLVFMEVFNGSIHDFSDVIHLRV